MVDPRSIAKEKRVLILFDTGSGRSYVVEEVVSRLGLGIESNGH